MLCEDENEETKQTRPQSDISRQRPASTLILRTGRDSEIDRRNLKHDSLLLLQQDNVSTTAEVVNSTPTYVTRK